MELSEISRGGGGVENRGRSQFFEPFKREGYIGGFRGGAEGGPLFCSVFKVF